MNAKIYCLSDKYLLGRNQSSNITSLSKFLFSKGIRIDNINILPNLPQSDFDSITKYESKQNLYLYLVDSATSFEFIVSHLCSKLSLEREMNELAKKIISKKFSDQNLPLTKDAELFWNIPKTSHIVENIYSNIQGVVANSGADNYLILPADKKELIPTLIKSLQIIGVDQQKYKNNQTFKCFGLKDDEVKNVLSDLIKNKDKVSITTFANGLNVDILIKSKSEENVFSQYVGKVFERLSKHIYAEEDISMEQALFQLLKSHNSTFSICESITCGNVVNRLIKTTSEANNFIKSNIVFSNPTSILKGISVDEKIILTHGKASAQTAYQLCLNMLTETGADLACSNIFEFTSSNSCTCLIALGDKSAIHVYKNTFYGDRDEIIEEATQATYFYIIKKLRKNDFHFPKKIV